MIGNHPDRKVLGCPCPLCDGPPHMIISFRGVVKILAAILGGIIATMMIYATFLSITTHSKDPPSGYGILIQATGGITIVILGTLTALGAGALGHTVIKGLQRLWHDNPTITLGKKPPPIPPAHTRSRK